MIPERFKKYITFFLLVLIAVVGYGSYWLWTRKVAFDTLALLGPSEAIKYSSFSYNPIDGRIFFNDLEIIPHAELGIEKIVIKKLAVRGVYHAPLKEEFAQNATAEKVVGTSIESFFDSLTVENIQIHHKNGFTWYGDFATFTDIRRQFVGFMKASKWRLTDNTGQDIFFFDTLNADDWKRFDFVRLIRTDYLWHYARAYDIKHLEVTGIRGIMPSSWLNLNDPSLKISYSLPYLRVTDGDDFLFKSLELNDVELTALSSSGKIKLYQHKKAIFSDVHLLWLGNAIENLFNETARIFTFSLPTHIRESARPNADFLDIAGAFPLGEAKITDLVFDTDAVRHIADGLIIKNTYEDNYVIKNETQLVKGGVLAFQHEQYADLLIPVETLPVFYPSRIDATLSEVFDRHKKTLHQRAQWTILGVGRLELELVGESERLAAIQPFDVAKIREMQTRSTLVQADLLFQDMGFFADKTRLSAFSKVFSQPALQEKIGTVGVKAINAFLKKPDTVKFSILTLLQKYRKGEN